MSSESCSATNCTKRGTWLLWVHTIRSGIGRTTRKPALAIRKCTTVLWSTLLHRLRDHRNQGICLWVAWNPFTCNPTETGGHDTWYYYVYSPPTPTLPAWLMASHRHSNNKQRQSYTLPNLVATISLLRGNLIPAAIKAYRGIHLVPLIQNLRRCFRPDLLWGSWEAIREIGVRSEKEQLLGGFCSVNSGGLARMGYLKVNM